MARANRRGASVSAIPRPRLNRPRKVASPSLSEWPSRSSGGSEVLTRGVRAGVSVAVMSIPQSVGGGDGRPDRRGGRPASGGGPGKCKRHSGVARHAGTNGENGGNVRNGGNVWYRRNGRNGGSGRN